jgi:hypothetical protein
MEFSIHDPAQLEYLPENNFDVEDPSEGREVLSCQSMVA